MKLHIFNPDHDLALAANLPNFTPPHAGRQLRSDLAFIPALWADEGDLVLVDDIDSAHTRAQRLSRHLVDRVEFITAPQLAKAMKVGCFIDSIHPWGWNVTLKHELLRIGTPSIMLPADDNLLQLRNISSRKWAACNLQTDVIFITDLQQLHAIIDKRGTAVVKAPWSSSGRGVRYVSAEEMTHAQPGILSPTERWTANIIRTQGGVTVEPLYNKVKDFGMEFEMQDGKISYLGLSLFHTQKNAYTGNLLTSEEEKLQQLLPYTSEEELIRIRKKIIGTLEPAIRNIYSGPFGVDMMVCSGGANDSTCFINPCIELNLRRTMGHVALAIGAPDNEPARTMQVTFDGSHYHLNIRRIEQTVKENIEE